MRWLTLAAVLLTGCGFDRAPLHSGARSDHGAPHVLPGRLAVEWKPEATKEQIVAEEQRLGLHARFNSPEIPADELTVVDEQLDPAADLAALRSDPLVAAAEPMYEYDALFVPNDPEYPRQWHLQQIGAEEAWNWGVGADVVVAVIDTGVADLPDLPKSALVQGHDFIHHTAEAVDDQGHGSHVAGTIAQATNNGVGTAGIAHGAMIMPIKVLNRFGAGQSVDIADGIRWAVDHGAKVLNLSLGGSAYSQIMADAVSYAQRRGAVVVCAAGNNAGPVGFPAAYDGALAVSAVRFDRQLAPYSSFGPEIDLAAPGGDMTVDQNGDGFPDGVLQQTIGGQLKWLQGTSMAAPHVAGAAALLASAGVTRADAIERILLSTATPLGDRQKFGWGEVDIAAAIRQVRLTGGLWRLGLAILLTGLAVVVIRRNGEKVAPLGVLGWFAMILASSGLFFLPWFGLGHDGATAVLAMPLPEWGRFIHGAQASNAFWLSASGPFFALGASRWKLVQGVAAAICFGFAAYLLHAAATGWVDIAWIPGRFLEACWLGVNGALAFGFGTMAVRSGR